VKGNHRVEIGSGEHRMAHAHVARDEVWHAHRRDERHVGAAVAMEEFQPVVARISCAEPCRHTAQCSFIRAQRFDRTACGTDAIRQRVQLRRIGHLHSPPP
jgi:hypothetical protein